MGEALSIDFRRLRVDLPSAACTDSKMNFTHWTRVPGDDLRLLVFINLGRRGSIGAPCASKRAERLVGMTLQILLLVFYRPPMQVNRLSRGVQSPA